MKIKTLREPSEKEIQQQIIDYLHYKHIFVKRLNVGGMINHQTGKYIFNPNTPRGIADLLIVIDGHTIFCECKARKGKQSDNQRLFEAEATQAGATYFIVRSLDDVIAKLKELNDKKKSK